MFRLPGGVVARVGRSGLRATAEREVRIARWLYDHGIAVTHPLPDVRQPTMVSDRPVTWWFALPPHRPGTPAELGAVLRAVHALPLPEFRLPVNDPFNGLDGRLNYASMLDADDRRWLTEHCRRLRDEYSQVVPFQAPQLIHGDAWQGNVAVVENEPPVLLDFEKVAIGDPAWDLVQVAVDHTDFTRIGTAAYAGFVNAYGAAMSSNGRAIGAVRPFRSFVGSRSCSVGPRPTPKLCRRLATASRAFAALCRSPGRGTPSDMVVSRSLRSTVGSGTSGRGRRHRRPMQHIRARNALCATTSARRTIYARIHRSLLTRTACTGLWREGGDMVVRAAEMVVSPDRTAAHAPVRSPARRRSRASAQNARGLAGAVDAVTDMLRRAPQELNPMPLAGDRPW